MIAVFLRLRWPRGRLLAWTAAYGALAFAIPYALLYWALTQATAGSATVVMAGVPLVTLLLAVSQRLERLDTGSSWTAPHIHRRGSGKGRLPLMPPLPRHRLQVSKSVTAA